jgi:hypothetical protein
MGKPPRLTPSRRIMLKAVLREFGFRISFMVLAARSAAVEVPGGCEGCRKNNNQKLKGKNERKTALLGRNGRTSSI